MISSILAPRSDLADCSPSTHLIASVILLLPLPLGTNNSCHTFIKLNIGMVGKDLNPMASIDFK